MVSFTQELPAWFNEIKKIIDGIDKDRDRCSNGEQGVYPTALDNSDSTYHPFSTANKI